MKNLSINNILKKYNILNVDILIMFIAILLQSITAIWAKNDLLSFVSGLAGIISVVLCSQRKLSFYLFGFIQLFTYIILAYRECLWGEVVENIFYIITMVVGIFIWIKNYNKKRYEVNSKELNIDIKVLCVMTFMFGTVVVFLILKGLDDPYPFLDAVSTVPAFIAQILMICGYKEQWRYWLVVDISSIVLWAMIGNIFMVVQFVLWTLNCIYGIYKWEMTNEQ